MITTTEEALRVAEGGADIMVAQGSEAGGHRSTFGVDSNNEPPLIGTMALVPQLIDACHPLHLVFRHLVFRLLIQGDR
jgi:nitronate monooxygenase